MRKVFFILAAAAMVAGAGCAKQAPEDAAKGIVEKLIATRHQGFIFDTSDLEYRVIEEEDDFAKVMVSGEIEVTGEMALVKEGGKWVAGGKPAVVEKAVPAAGAVPAVAKTPGKSEARKGH